jgi:hypothetical protein
MSGVAACGRRPLAILARLRAHVRGRSTVAAAEAVIEVSAGFDTLGYLAANPDVAAAHVNPLDHFLQNGIYEGRAAVNDGPWQ